MRSLLAVVLACAPAAAAEAPSDVQAADALLVEAFGRPGVEALAARGIVVLQGRPASRRLAAVHWKALASFSSAAPSCLALAGAADAVSSEEASSPALDISACRALPPDGMMTPSLHALASALQAAHEESWALRLASAPAGAPGRANVFDAPWGKDLVSRLHADMLEDPSALAEPVFDDLLAGPRPDKEAAALIAAEASERGETAVAKLMAEDGAAGALSEPLRRQLIRTLSNERRRWARAKARAQAAALLGKAAVKRELEDLRSAAQALAARPGFPVALEAASSRAAPAAEGGAHLKSAGLHLQTPTRLGQHELGDAAIVSGAYWVDGLPENQSIEVEETLSVETERGFASSETKVYKRRNGGPYPFARAVRISEIRPFAVRSMISAGGPALVERVEVPVARDFELALIKESGAAALRASCIPKDAEAAYAELETLVAEPAKIKPQYMELSRRARSARKAALADAETLAKLEAAVAAARDGSAADRCDYETARADDAIKLARLLPPGCDKDLPELHEARARLSRRAVDRDWFMKASSQARAKRNSCDLDAARTRWSEAFAYLDAEPEARCGRVAEEEKRAKAEFSELMRRLAWREELGKSLDKAEAESSPERRLGLLRPVTARLGELRADCMNAEAKRASMLSETAGKALAAPAEEEAAKRLPAETSLASAKTEIRAERAKRLEAVGASERAAAEPPKPAADKAPAPAKASAKPQAKPKAKSKGAAAR